MGRSNTSLCSASAFANRPLTRRDCSPMHGVGSTVGQSAKGILAVLNDFRVVHRDEHLHTRRVQAVNQIVWGELKGGGDDHRADFM